MNRVACGSEEGVSDSEEAIDIDNNLHLTLTNSPKSSPND